MVKIPNLQEDVKNPLAKFEMNANSRRNSANSRRNSNNGAKQVQHFLPVMNHALMMGDSTN